MANAAASAVPPPPGLGPLQVPRSMVDEVNANRKACFFFQSSGRCRKGAACVRLHESGDRQLDFGSYFRVPHVSRCISADGTDSIKLRPPINEALELLFKNRGVNRTMFGSQMLTINGQECVTFQLDDMEGLDLLNLSRAKCAGGADVFHTDGSRVCWKGVSTSTNIDPRYIGHGTTPENGLLICVDGHVAVSPGIAGHGIYCFDSGQDVVTEADALRALWDRTNRGKYNFGCLIMGKCNKVTVLREVSPDCSVPGGCVSYKGDQLAFARGVFEYTTATFTVEGLVGSLAALLDKFGYSVSLHQALANLAEHVQLPVEQRSRPLCTLLNKLVKASAVGVDRSPWTASSSSKATTTAAADAAALAVGGSDEIGDGAKEKEEDAWSSSWWQQSSSSSRWSSYDDNKWRTDESTHRYDNCPWRYYRKTTADTDVSGQGPLKKKAA
jgi:hypothetical protein